MGLMGLGARGAFDDCKRTMDIYISFLLLETLFATGLTTTPLVVQQHLRLADNRYMKGQGSQSSAINRHECEIEMRERKKKANKEKE
jgi:hypothetical protein